jgi:hypothetical protein
MRYAARWPVLDLECTLSELSAEARPLLTGMLLAEGVDPVGTDPEWRIRESATGAVFLHVLVDVVPAGRRSGA